MSPSGPEFASAAAERAETAPSLRSRPGLGIVTLRRDGGGIAYASRLIERALRDAAPEPWIVAVDPARYDGVSPRERLTFAMRLVAGQLARRADWVLFTHLNLARLQNVVPSILRPPYGVFVHDIEAWNEDIGADRVRAMRAATLRLANSRYTAKRVMQAHPSVGAVLACPLGLLPEVPAGQPDPAIMRRLSQRTVLLTGRMSAAERYKGHDELLDAWPAVLARVSDAQLVFAGSGDDIERLRQKAALLGVAERVFFSGFVDDATLAGLTRRAAVFAMPSRREGFGLVYLEAMREGVPCVASRADAAGDTVVHDETGLLVDGQDPRDIATALITLLTDPKRRAAMGDAGRKRFQQLFTFERFKERLLPILQQAFDAA